MARRNTARTGRAARSQVLARARAAALLLPLALALVAGSAWTPVGAAEQQLDAPTAGAVIAAAFEVAATVTPAEGEVVEAVEARVTGPGERQLGLERTDPPEEPGPQTWRGAVDPLGGIPLPNGRHRVEVRTVPLVDEPGPWTGHDVDLRVPPPTRELVAEPGADDPTAVELSWSTVALPDFVAYRVQRRPDAEDGTWSVVHDLGDARQDRVVDVVPQPGAYRYRLVVVRGDGAGSELFATSDPRGVRADPADPGTFSPPREPDPEPQEGSTPPGGGVSPIQRPDDGRGTSTPTPAPSVGRPGTSGQPGVQPSAPLQGRAPEPAPAAPRPAIVPLDDGIFAESLPFAGPTSTELEVGRTETAMIDGGRTPGGDLNVLEDTSAGRGPLVAAAGGLLLLVASGHLRRFLSEGAVR